jgi:two-component system NarL family sensor kinase
MKGLILIGTIIFLIAPVFVVVFTMVYNKRKKRHLEEKEQMEQNFNNELVKTQHEIREQTMQTIGADLHDNVGQLLSLTSFTLKSIAYGEPDTMMKKVNDAIELTSRSIQEMRLLGKLLQGEQLIGVGLNEAIKQEVNWLEKTGHYQVSYTCEGIAQTISNPEKDLILFRILQEVINNTIKHAQATAVTIKLSYHNGQLLLTIADNGVGFDAGSTPDDQMGMGLQNMRKRAAMIGGETTIKSVLGDGTHTHIFIPYP